MRFHFDPKQEHQLDAIDAVLRVFEGQPAGGSSEAYHQATPGEAFAETGFANRLALDEKQILENVHAIQRENISKHGKWEAREELDGMHFSVEMETGTGKTYVYLRTIYELGQKYGFRKFVIVVPSIAVREGVLKNLRITEQHLQNLYNKPPTRFEVYDSSRVSSLRAFAASDATEILVINIDSFAKDQNVINRDNDKLMGQKPIDFIRRVNPIVIVDEPQNMETKIRKQAIENLNYLCTLRYSATHVSDYNMIYSLDPAQAYDLRLVKRIVVDSVLAENDFNEAYVRLKKINTRPSLSATLEMDCNTKKGVQRKSVTARLEKGKEDLYALSGNREIYRNGYIINEIDAEKGFVVLSGGKRLSVGETLGGLNDEIMRAQIRETVAEHFSREKQLQLKGVKVISLFFIDRVANYRGYDKEGRPVKGKLAEYFEEVFNEFSTKEDYADLDLVSFTTEKVHDGYFSQDRGKWRDTKGNTLADRDTYKLIMQDKERLLDPKEPLRFIFSHSALREGWDNPNVFQICTLNETQSELKKRQEIGRGMRLPVDGNGNRISDENINWLTVIANESYEDFARQLQIEIEDECGVDFGGRIKNKKERKKVSYREDFQLDEKFKALWEQIKHQTTYRVEYDTEKLIESAAKAVKNMEKITMPSLRIGKAKIDIQRNEGVTLTPVGGRTSQVETQAFVIPDLFSYIQSQGRARLTRSTIQRILLKSGRLGDVLINPQGFMDRVIALIDEKLSELMIDGIKYEKNSDKEYELRLFEGYEFHGNKHTFEIGDEKKTINTGLLPLDSDVEHRFAKDCENWDNIEFYFKLPSWFKIKTPIGNYNPDWALVIEKDSKKIYFVAETKSDDQELRPSEKNKIECGKAHYEILNVEFRQVSEVEKLLD